MLPTELHEVFAKPPAQREAGTRALNFRDEPAHKTMFVFSRRFSKAELLLYRPKLIFLMK
jgi:hypothetical protein